MFLFKFSNYFDKIILNAYFQLEDTIANQNSLIESLKESLEYEKTKSTNLTEELYVVKKDARNEVFCWLRIKLSGR